MATSKSKLNGAASVVREEDLVDLENFQKDLEQRVEQAYTDGRAFMMAKYVSILAGIKSEAKRLRDRFDRETLAAHRAAQKELAASEREKAQTARDNA